MNDSEGAEGLAAGDDAARLRIRESLDESLLVEAAAGTGKTTELVHRIVATLRSGRARAETVVAVTFTRKAAGELKLRLRQELDRALRIVLSEEERERLTVAISRLEEARIGTIHSFCAQILRERPVEAGVDPEFEELDEGQARALYSRAFDTFIQARLQEMPEGLRRALSRLAIQPGPAHLGSPIERLRDAGYSLVDWRDFDAPWRRDAIDRTAWIDRLVDRVKELTAWLGRGSPRDRLAVDLEPLTLLGTWVDRWEAVAARDHDALEARFLDLRAKLRQRRLGKGGNERFAEGLPRRQLVTAVERLQEELDTFCQAADADLAALLRRELEGALEGYERLKTRLGRLDYMDLLLRARRVIKGGRAVRAFLQQSISHIFVDEFQDTDPLQAEILLLLAADDPEVTDWRRVRPRPGKLFLVGDPKQSIYRFRRADVRLYQEIKQQLEDNQVSTLLLNRSFRSVPAIQQLVNAAFEKPMNGDLESGRAEYIPLAPVRPPLEGVPPVVVLPAPRPYGYWRVTQRAVEACLPEAVGAFIHWLLEDSGYAVYDAEKGQLEPVASRHICVLFRRFMSWGRDMTRDYVRDLEERGVPHLLVGARTFHQREEVETLRAALTAIEWPDDELALFATLRGSLFAFSDEQLLRYRALRGSLNPFGRGRRTMGGVGGREAEPAGGDNGGADLPQDLAAIRVVLDFLADLHRRRNHRAFVETVRSLLHYSRSHAGFALRPAGHQVLANVERVCDLARSYELASGRSFRGFVEQLNDEAERPGGAQGPIVEEGEGVRLMTVHAAKGLEFPVVILADLTTQATRRMPERVLDPEQHLNAALLLGCAPAELLEGAEEELERDRAEAERVAYVAATRARDLLVVPAVGDGPMEGWLSPLNAAVYPDAGSWRQSQPAAGAPPFGDKSVLARPSEHDGRLEGSVRPGLHLVPVADCDPLRRSVAALGEGPCYPVVWWDPAALPAPPQGSYGLFQEELLTEDVGGEVATANQEDYARWLEEEEKTRQHGSTPSLEVFAVTELEEAPPAAAKGQRSEPRIQVIELERSLERPSGQRFGTLVHTLLRDVALSAADDDIAELARSHARLLGSPDNEVGAATVAVAAALRHPILERARQALPEDLLREAPFVLPQSLAGQQRLIEGVIDLAIRDDNGWLVVDFKTDLALEPRRADYERQLGWYLHALEEESGQPARGVLLMV